LIYSVIEGLSYRSFAAAGENQPVAVGQGGQLVDVIHRTALGPAAQLSLTDRPAKGGVTGGVSGQHQEM